MRRKKRTTIDDMVEDERPRERLLQSGPGVLTDADLVAVLFGTGGPGRAFWSWGRGSRRPSPCVSFIGFRWRSSCS